MLKKEQHNLFIWSVICIFGTIGLLSVFLYSTDKLILDVSGITKSEYTSQQHVYTPVSDKVHFKIVSTTVKPSIKRPIEQKAHTSTYDRDHFKIISGHTDSKHPMEKSLVSSKVLEKSNPFPASVREAAAFIPEVMMVNHVLKVGEYTTAPLLKLAFHSVKIIGKHS
ncbi:MAG: hypothetical protein K0R48_1299 [Gammaproteobacteria bacterium]|jgi:hypothetical protein|nr:hypothetical protein [Gammaproteobacteria bacterium]